MMRWLLRFIWCLPIIHSQIGLAQGTKVKIMTYNIRLDVASDSLNRWDYRKAFLLEQIQTTNPDVLGVQEALPNQVEYLQKGLKKYLKIGVGREENLTGEASCLYIKTERFMVKDSGTFWLSETPEKVSRGWDAACNRVCTFAHLEDRTTGKRCWIFNTHWDHVGEKARTESLKLTLEQIQQLNLQKEPVIYIGDFNSTPDHERWQLLKNEWIDTWHSLHSNNPDGTFNAFDPKRPATAYIDYIWVTRDHFKILESSILVKLKNGRFPSDHFPVVSTLSFLP
ncbi:endonuclease/exonuclease/phosphatase family protein [Flavobacterium sp. N1719]|uniref:endonuclease/exonuclease/phosphatase family protein n=1 Tax=Flavobacterium sp. N1719 TaxID=2885633 RepID=UPI00222134B3|nr:endonuclease/exonuclease/phosphatase family protein [Flavobacterium sp. N1719]